MTARAEALHEPAALLAARLTELLQRLCPLAGDELPLAVGAVLQAGQDGHTCAALGDIAAATAGDMRWRDAAALRAALLASGAVADAAVDAEVDSRPLVLDGRDRLYLRRHFLAERQLASALRQRLAPPPQPPAETLAALRALVKPGGDADSQAVAVAAAVRARLCVITGGPGTGKTTTIRALLQVLLAGEPDLEVALAAPTGKAAARMAEALQGSLPGRELPQPTTLHRLLGYLQLEDSFRRNRQTPLPHDLVVVDEASMVDLEVMAALLAALKPEARLVLLGDRDQLSSVAVGQVLGDLCRAAAPERGVGAGLQAFCREHLGLRLPGGGTSPFADVVVALRKNFRFAADSGIGAFATALTANEPAGAAAAITAGRADLSLLPHRPLDELLRPWTEQLLAATVASSPAAALAAQPALRILCATRHGPFGVDAVNTAVEALLREHGRADGAHYAGQPVLITSNDHQTRLWNGELGVLWPDAQADDQVMAWFPASSRAGPDAAPRKFLPLRLPPHETAWAMTVHKAQGSEFDEVLVLLPDRPSPVLNAPLVYTAITRARRRATVVADAALLAAALAARPQRASGLLDLLLQPGGGRIEA